MIRHVQCKKERWKGKMTVKGLALGAALYECMDCDTQIVLEVDKEA